MVTTLMMTHNGRQYTLFCLMAPPKWSPSETFKHLDMSKI
jgi:hypothetical protein